MKKKNLTAKILFYAGIVVIIIGIFFCIDTIRNFNLEMKQQRAYQLEGEVINWRWTMLSNYLTSSFTFITSGLLIIGAAEVVEQVNRLNNKKLELPIAPSQVISETTSESVLVEKPSPPTREVKPYDENAVPEDVQKKIKDYYRFSKETDMKFYQTPYSNIVLVVLNDNEYKAIIVDSYGVEKELPPYAWGNQLTKWMKEEGFTI